MGGGGGFDYYYSSYWIQVWTILNLLTVLYIMYLFILDSGLAGTIIIVLIGFRFGRYYYNCTYWIHVWTVLLLLFIFFSGLDSTITGINIYS